MFETKSVDAVLQELESSKQGLSAQQAAERLARDGANALKEKDPPTRLQMFFSQLKDPMIYVLLAAAAISIALGEFSDSIIILGVVLLNAIVGMVQEGKAQRALDALKKMSSPTATVRRDGIVQELPAADLVKGDIVLLDAGRIIPADLRLTTTASLKVDESALTGESVPVEKDADLVIEKDAPLGDRHNMAYSSTSVTYGRGEGVVVATAGDTEIGKIASMLQDADELTPLQKSLAVLGKLLGIIAILLCVALFLAVLLLFRDSEHISAAYGLALTITMITTTILLGIYLWHRSNKFGAVVFTIVFLAIQVLFFAASMAKFLHGGWFTLLLTLAILMVMYTWNEGTKLERSQRRHMMPKDFLPALDKLHGDSRIHRFADNIVYLTSDPDLKRLDTDIFFSIFADHPKRARAWWAVAVETTDEPFTREYSVESFGTDYLFRVRIRLGFKVSQSIPAYLHQIMHDLEKTGELPNQQSIYPKLDADPGIGTIRYVVIHKALMPESKVSGRGALSLQIKYAIRRVAGSPVKWFGLAPYNPLVEVQPLFVSTRRPPRLTRVASQAPKREG